MRVINWFFRNHPANERPSGVTLDKNFDVVRVEIPFITRDEQEYTVIVLDADDSFDVVINYPNDQRETVFSIAKE